MDDQQSCGQIPKMFFVLVDFFCKLAANWLPSRAINREG